MPELSPKETLNNAYKKDPIDKACLEKLKKDPDNYINEANIYVENERNL